VFHAYIFHCFNDNLLGLPVCVTAIHVSCRTVKITAIQFQLLFVATVTNNGVNVQNVATVQSVHVPSMPIAFSFYQHRYFPFPLPEIQLAGLAERSNLFSGVCGEDPGEAPVVDIK